jgi:transcriptional regulator with XRE-family HTH domain
VTESTDVFDSEGFFKALESTVMARKLRWKAVSEETGISASTLSRMAQGRGPDAASQAVLAQWAGLNPADFVRRQIRRSGTEPLARLTAQLRRDPKLTREAADALEEVIKATYERLTRGNEST